MASYIWAGSHAYRDHANDRTIEPGDELAEEIAAAHPHDVEAVDEEDADSGDEAADVDEWANWNEDDWLDLDYEQRAADVQEGRVDDHLEAIAEIETSGNVEDAVDERLAELEE